MLRYRLRRKSDGLYSLGGYMLNCTTEGKTWNNIGAVRCSLKQAYKYGQYYQSMHLNPFKGTFEEFKAQFEIEVVEWVPVHTEYVPC